MKEAVFLNGKFISAQEAKVSALGPGFLYGWGLFETMRSYNRNIVYLGRHLERLKKSAELLDLIPPYSPSRIKSLAAATVKRCGVKDVYLRITLWDSASGTEFMIFAKEYLPPEPEKYKLGLSACISPLRQAEDHFFARIKTSSRILYELSYRLAKNNNFDEALILNNRGYICEASRSNIFFIKSGVLFTPALKCGCLPGITRQVVFDIAKRCAIPVEEGNFTAEDLLKSEGAFFTNSLIGIMPLTRIGKRLINNRRVHRLARLLMRQYARLLKA
jgi:branched-chain amino acid aminotransferase